nr:histidine phosphatase family protein [Fodinicola feengrottensis]
MDRRKAGRWTRSGRTARRSRTRSYATRWRRLFLARSRFFAAANRMVHCLQLLAKAHPGERILVVGHNTVIRLALCQLLGIDLSTYRRVLAAPDNVAVTELQVADRMFRLARFNAPLSPVDPIF